jgi:hypothetical protein
MPQLGFEPTIPGFERAKTVHALDRVATVIGKVQFSNVYFMLRAIGIAVLLFRRYGVNLLILTHSHVSTLLLLSLCYVKRC